MSVGVFVGMCVYAGICVYVWESVCECVGACVCACTPMRVYVVRACVHTFVCACVCVFDVGAFVYLRVFVYHMLRIVFFVVERCK